MPDKRFKSYAPFGIATKRFAKIGFHPELDKSGAMKREITKLGPGSYNPTKPQCKSKHGMGWQHKLEMEEFSKFLGFRNAHILNERLFYKSLGGPGNVEIDEKLFKRADASQMQDVGFGSGKRIREEIVGQDAPPPDTYFRRGLADFQPAKKTFSKVPTFEFDGLADRFKSDAKSYHLPPALYDLKDGKNVADILKKAVTARGPYDCFTGPRDGTTIKNHFSLPLTTGPDYFYVKPTSLQHLLIHPTKKRCGKFFKGPRFQKKPTVRHMLNDLSLCYRDPDSPGPAQYDLSNSSIKKLPPSKYAFNSSNVHARPPTNWQISPGPGRYNPKAPRCMKVKKPSWVFLSKADRNLIKVIHYSAYE